MTLSPFAPYSLSAFNISQASENKIHDDTVAARLGFAGALVPGVEVYAYATHFPLALWGRPWLERGTMDCKLLKPVYDGRIITVAASRSVTGLDFTVESEKVFCASGSANLPPEPMVMPDLADFPVVPARRERPHVNASVFPVGEWLGADPFEVTEDYASSYLRDVRETNPIYSNEKLVHPGIILRMCNWSLSHNVQMSAWIHIASAVRNLGLARVGDVLTTRAKVLANYDRKGHKIAELDILVLANDCTPVARVHHSAIYCPRQLAELISSD
ncbi:hotdog family protein [Belnapia rosea]|jgi:hypothetical protein|uniref:Acyl dehydratase n=1 Tax=Belnapia rosea TaxID=938405 RepID=A0A1G6KC15_9PROT|nr:hypothetical protein [Belnapia rosea]SDC28115.1 hypothetical protein SAMN04487779_1001451 [Belnapia rosea]